MKHNLEQQAARALQVARRVGNIEPFRVMEMVKAAGEMRRAGVDVISLSVGEPDFTAPELVAEAAMAAIRAGATQYTDSLGLHTLREAIAGHYQAAFGVTVDPRRIVITAGASAALLLACAALVDEGDEVLMPDPCYPCNRHFVSRSAARRCWCRPAPPAATSLPRLRWPNAGRRARAASSSHPPRTRPAPR